MSVSIKGLGVLFFWVVLVFSASADDFVRLESQRTYKKTISEMRKQIREQGWDLQKHVDHAKAAQKFGESLPPSSVFLVSKPFYISVLVQRAPSVSVDIPFRIAVYQEKDGKTWLMYRKPETFLKDHGVDGSKSESLDEFQEKLETELKALTEASVKALPEKPKRRSTRK